MDLAHIPMLAGAVMIANDDEDIRKTIVLGMGLALIGLLVIEAAGLRTGAAGTVITTAMGAIMGYFFRGKEEEARVTPRLNN